MILAGRIQVYLISYIIFVVIFGLVLGRDGHGEVICQRILVSYPDRDTRNKPANNLPRAFEAAFWYSLVLAAALRGPSFKPLGRPRSRWELISQYR